MRVRVGDITKVQNIDAIVNAANGIGVMGAGVAGAIARSGGLLLLENVKAVVENHGPFDVGNVYISDAGLLKRRGVNFVYHAVTMKYPGGQTSLGTIGPLLEKVLQTAIENGVTSIAFGGLGCGIGGLTKQEVAKRMANISSNFDRKIKITVIDTNEEFIEEFKNNLNIPIENDDEVNNKSPDFGAE